MDLSDAIPYRMAMAWPPTAPRPASPPRRSAARLPGAGGDAAKVLEEVRRRLAVGPEHDELVAEAVADVRAGSKAAVVMPVPIGRRRRPGRACRASSNSNSA